MKQEIKLVIESVIKSLGLDKTEFVVEHPAEIEHGDYATNVAMVSFRDFAKAVDAHVGEITWTKGMWKNPRELAEDIVEKLKGEEKLKKIAEKITVEGPGFINISIKNDVLIKQTGRLLKEGQKKPYLEGKKVMVEFTDPNPFKEFHIGHLYSNIVGESLARLFEANGAEVKRANYQGDVGMHVAKSIWGMRKKMAGEGVKLADLEKKNLKDKQKFMGQAYALGATAYEKDKQAKEEMEELNKQIYELDEKVKELYEIGRKWSLEYFEGIYKRLGTKFDFYFFERQVGEVGLKMVKEGLKKGVFVKSQGAVVYEGEKEGLHTRVFVNKQGLPTYEAKDLGLAVMKNEKFKYDQSFNVTGKEINEYFKVVLAAMKRVKPELWKKTTHIGHGMVKLPSGKMSSRTGKIVIGEWLLDEAKQQALEIMKESEVKDKEGVAEMVGKAAVKYALLRSGIGQDVVFDFKSSVSFEGNSGPYLQYTYARTKSVLGKAKVEVRLPKAEEMSKEEEALVRTMYKYGEVVEEAAKELAPNQVASFLYDMAQKYNGFYNKHRILKAEKNKELRLWLTAAVGEIIKQGLDLLGIEAPERM